MPIRRVRKAAKSAKHVAQKVSQDLHHHLAHWLTRGLEFFAVLTSLLWSLEAVAQPKIISEKKHGPLKKFSLVEKSRAPASVGQSGKGDALADQRTMTHSKTAESEAAVLDKFINGEGGENDFIKDSFFSPHGGLFMAPESVFMGKGLAPSFRASPYYVPTTFELMRFPFFGKK